MRSRQVRPSSGETGQLKVLFEASWWSEGPPSLRRVLRESILTWQERFPNDHLALIVKPDARESAIADLGAGVTVRTTRWRPQALAAMVATVIPSMRMRPDVVFTHNFTSLTPFAKRVVLVHDFMFCEHPEWFTRAENAYFSLMPRTAPAATMIFATSQTEAGRISHYLGGRTVVPVGLGMSRDLMHAPTAQELPASLSDLGSGRFVLSVGRLNARKNLMVTIEAALAAGILSADFPLLVVGSSDGLQDEVPQKVRDAVKAGLVRYTGFVDDSVLVWLYRNCRFFTFLSLDEGYGLPPLEALEFGAPVLVSDIPVFRELLADLRGVTFSEPHDVEAIAAKMRSLAIEERAPDGESGVRDRHSWESVVDNMRAAIVGMP